MTGAVVLAAGASKRLGQPKQLVILAGETLLDRAVRTAVEAGCTPVVVVLGAHLEQIAAGTTLAGAQVVINANWQEGMAASIRTGIGALQGAVAGAVILTCDQPLVCPAHLRALIERGPTDITASRYAGRSGVPAYFPASRFAELMGLRGDAGARAMITGAAALAFEAGQWDVDTPEALEAVRRRLQET